MKAGEGQGPQHLPANDDTSRQAAKQKKKTLVIQGAAVR